MSESKQDAIVRKQESRTEPLVDGELSDEQLTQATGAGMESGIVSVMGSVGKISQAMVDALTKPAKPRGK